MKTFDTNKLFDEFEKCSHTLWQKNYIMAISGVSMYRMNKARKSNMDFNNLTVWEIIDIQKAINDMNTNVIDDGKRAEWKQLDIDFDTSQIYYDLLSCLQDKDAKRIITALSGVSPYRMKKAIKSEDDFNYLKLNDVIKIGELIDDIYNNVYDL